MIEVELHRGDGEADAYFRGIDRSFLVIGAAGLSSHEETDCSYKDGGYCRTRPVIWLRNVHARGPP
jgi:hypothetical protein